jgi:hypothetical protein
MPAHNLPNSISTCFEGAQLQPCPEFAQRVRRCQSFIFVITSRLQSARDLLLPVFLQTLPPLKKLASTESAST